MTTYFPRLARGVGSYPIDDSVPASEQFGLGVVGLHEGRTALVASNRTRHVRPIVGCDLDETAIADVRHDLPNIRYTTDYDQLLADPAVDIVGVYTPDPTHGGLIVKAFEAGKHVVATKPMVSSLDDARAVLEASRRTGRKLIVGQSTRFFESMRRQRAAFERGELGELEVVEAHYTHRMDWYYEGRPWLTEGADWVFLGMSHPLDMLRWYLGSIETVSAVGSRSAVARENGIAGNDIYSVNALTADGRVGRAFGHYGMHELPRARNSVECMLYGTDGTSLSRYHDMQYLHAGHDGVEHVEDMLYEYRHYHFNNEVHGMHYGEFANYLEYFALALASGSDYSPGVEEGVETVCLMEAVHRSVSQGGAPVEIAPILREVGL